MNTIDLIVCLVAAWAVWSGWRRGCVQQICSLAGIAAAIWLAARFGAEAGRLLRLDSEVAAVGGFVVVLIVMLIAIGIAGRILRRIFRFAGLGLADILLGIALSLAKYLLLLSVAFSAFDSLNGDYGFVEESKLASSRTYRPVKQLSDNILPLIEKMGDEASELINDTEKQ